MAGRHSEPGRGDARAEGAAERSSAGSWGARLHALWMVTERIDDVTAMADHVYGLLIDEPGVVAVVGTRWRGASLTYYRRLTEGAADGIPVTGTPATAGPADGTARARELYADAGRTGPVAGRTGPVLSDHAPSPAAGPGTRPGTGPDLAPPAGGTEPTGPFEPEARLCAEAGARVVLESRFVLGGDDWAALSVGVADPADLTPELRERLTQVADVLVAINSRILATRAHERRQVQDALLAEASLQMDESLDVADTLSRVARLAVPAVAEGCVVHLAEPGAGLEPVAWAHVAATGQDWLAGVARDDLWLGGLLRRVTARREGLLLRGDALAESPFGPGGDGPGASVRAVSVRPLRARGRTLGTLTFLYERVDDGLTDPQMLDDLAHRAALAIHTSIVHDQRRRHVEQLQRHLLPPALPTHPGVLLSSGYAVGDASLDVGGDFYDAVLHEDRVALFIGDVCGRGAEAAAMTGLARHTLRTLLEDGVPPGRAMERLNTALVRDGASRFVTALVCVLEPEDGGGYRVTSAGGGHPHPLVLRADGTVETVRVPGMLLGVVPDAEHPHTVARLARGDTLVLFTDGLTEARGADGSMFEDRLADAVRRCGREPKTAAERLIDMAADFRARGDDDTAVLVAHVEERP
ncbi:GAF domain-containing SpoIIE family protein phosphatase [Streptomyces sp. NPDC005805]|uniref:PP2C family protein-serine/threonine phosphatase n=1 Tax=Streptomyces sp. NPDC005805 TaxID=3157068 RepID=UPI0033F4AC15